MTDYNRKGRVSADEGNQWLAQWSEHLDVGTICLFGGEPLMNSDLPKWIQLVRQYWPNATIKIITNGTYLDRRNILPNLFQVGNAIYQISFHWREGDKFEKVKSSLLQQVKQYPGWQPVNLQRSDIVMSFVKETVTVQLAVFGEFTKPYAGHGATMKPWNSGDPQGSYQRCGSPRNPVLYQGRIYKCGPTANLKDTLALHGIDSDPDWAPYLMPGYGIEDIPTLVDNFDKPHDVCSMCSNTADANIDHYAAGAVVEKKEIKWLR